MPTADVSVTDSAVEITSGLYDTDDGFKAKVSGDAFPRVHITPQGSVLAGNGTAAPTSIAGGSVDPPMLIDLTAEAGPTFALDLTTGPYAVPDAVKSIMVQVAANMDLTVTPPVRSERLGFIMSGYGYSLSVTDGAGQNFAADNELALYYEPLPIGFGVAMLLGPVFTPPTTAAPYIPADSAVWDGDPDTVAEAINRIAAVVGDTVPIP